ncbi:MAG: ferritin-like domain-containing protein, partial [Micrococcales bacterium]|nr:ferritin-like domain-containing protein [Micrococcales bacterium]
MNTTLARLALLTACCVGLVGCGLRMETSDPPVPTAGVCEHARARTVADATALADAASALAPDADAQVAAVLADITTFSAAHVQALGQTYTATPGPTDAPTVATPAALLAELATATTTAADDTDEVDDANLAQVLGSVATARAELVVRLADALDVAVPAAAAPPETLAVPSETVVNHGPFALSPARATTLVLAHDQAGYAYEVIAAQAPSASELRATALAAAEHHRAQATVWARAGGFDGTNADPRRAQYLVPANLADAGAARTLARSLELAVAQGAAAALGETSPGARGPVLADLRGATAAATSWGAAPHALPGLPPPAAP